MRTYWQTVNKDGSILSQFDEDGTEHLFSEINQDNVFEFRLIFDNRVVLSLFLDTGIFGINGFLYKTNLSNQNLDYELVYYKTNTVTIGDKPIEKDVYYRLGFKVNIDGKSHKRILGVHNLYITLIEGDLNSL